MSTTDTVPGSGPAPSAPSAPSAPTSDRKLRRSRNGRVGAGVAAGLGDYFGLDPVLFRVLFATSAFFGGAGIIAYLVAWAAIPEQGAEHAPVDDWIAAMRRRNVPPWALVLGAGLVLWVAAFSWWAPGPFAPALIVVVLLLVVFGRRGAHTPAPTDPAGATSPLGVDLSKPQTPGAAGRWFADSRAAARERRRRSFPVRIATLLALAVALIVLGAVDTVDGIPLPLYFVFTGGVALVGLLVGLALRRTPWALAGLLIPSFVGLIAFGATSARLHDGVGQRTWDPAVRPAASYRLALGHGTLDLRNLAAQERPRTVHVTMAAGRVTVIAPGSLNLVVETHVHLGNITVDGDESASDGGVNLDRTASAPKGATGEPVTVIVRLASGRVDVDHR